jgi:transposase
VHVAGYNLGLIMRLLVGAGTPREYLAGAVAHLVVLTAVNGVTCVIVSVASGTKTAMLLISFAPKPGN